MKKVYNKKIGLYFGSFNPIHNGHLILAEQILENSDLEMIWFVVSPQNPFKERNTLLDNRARYFLVQKAIEDNDKFRASDIEFSLPIPSYTIDTLTYLQEKFPDKEFTIIMGEDNLKNFHKWKNYQAILDYYRVFVYPRPNCEESEFLKLKNVIKINAPMIEISSSLIRSNIKEKKSIKYLLPENVRQEIEKNGYFL
ncbi:MAG: nicotinate-nucleotide adenylyltransferase [Bacteroidales bacterium]|nr:nicotinate-nucleotide adenylyltransferase [Bacteroidales bacterium]